MRKSIKELPRTLRVWLLRMRWENLSRSPLHLSLLPPGILLLPDGTATRILKRVTRRLKMPTRPSPDSEDDDDKPRELCLVLPRKNRGMKDGLSKYGDDMVFYW
jgi:hypothetical protein